VRKARKGVVEPGESLCDQCIDKCHEMISRVSWYAFGIVADLLNEGIQGVLPVQELP